MTKQQKEDEFGQAAKEACVPLREGRMGHDVEILRDLVEGLTKGNALETAKLLSRASRIRHN